MNLNATFIAQMVVFFILGWFTMKFVWPPLMKALDDRAKKIAEGLEAAEAGKLALESSSRQAGDEITKARSRAAEIIAQAEKRSVQMIEEAKLAARDEGGREKAAAKAEIEQETARAREALRDQVAALAVAGAEKILRREVNPAAHTELLSQLKKEI